MSSDRIKIHCIHADPVVYTGLLTMLKSEGGLDVSMTDPCAEPGEAVVIADYQQGLHFHRERRSRLGMHRLRILIVTHRDNDWDVHCATECGVHGYVLQNDVPEELLDAVRIVAGGGRYLSRTLRRSVDGNVGGTEELTGREREVLQLLGMGYCNKLIARELGISLSTVKSHMKAVLTKLNVTARTHAVIVAAQRGLLRIDSAATGLREQGGFGHAMR